jgi:hypothetical protein
MKILVLMVEGLHFIINFGSIRVQKVAIGIIYVEVNFRNYKD